MFSRNKQPAIKSLIAQGTRIEGDVHFVDGLLDSDVPNLRPVTLTPPTPPAEVR